MLSLLPNLFMKLAIWISCSPKFFLTLPPLLSEKKWSSSIKHLDTISCLQKPCFQFFPISVIFIPHFLLQNDTIITTILAVYFFPWQLLTKKLHCTVSELGSNWKTIANLTCPILSRFRLWGDLWFLMILHGRCFSNMHNNCWKYDQLSSTIITLIRPLNSLALVLCPIKALKKEPTTMLHSWRSTVIIEKIRKVKKRGGKHFFFKKWKNNHSNCILMYWLERVGSTELTSTTAHVHPQSD